MRGGRSLSDDNRVGVYGGQITAYATKHTIDKEDIWVGDCWPNRNYIIEFPVVWREYVCVSVCMQLYNIMHRYAFRYKSISACIVLLYPVWSVSALPYGNIYIVRATIIMPGIAYFVNKNTPNNNSTAVVAIKQKKKKRREGWNDCPFKCTHPHVYNMLVYRAPTCSI